MTTAHSIYITTTAMLKMAAVVMTVLRAGGSVAARAMVVRVAAARVTEAVGEGARRGVAEVAVMVPAGMATEAGPTAGAGPTAEGDDSEVCGVLASVDGRRR